MEFRNRKPLVVSKTLSIASLGSGTLVIESNVDVQHFIKSLTITKGSNITINSIKIDGVDIGLISDFDTVTEFGSIIYTEKIEVTGSNGGAAAEDLTVLIKGIKR